MVILYCMDCGKQPADWTMPVCHTDPSFLLYCRSQSGEMKVGIAPPDDTMVHLMPQLEVF